MQDLTPNSSDAGEATGVERVGACPICRQPDGTVLHSNLVDRLYGAGSGWILKSCGECGCAYLDPRPGSAALDAAYAEYYTHAAAAEPDRLRSLRRWRRSLRNGYLNRALGYRFAEASVLGTFVFAPLRSRRRQARFAMRDLRLPPGEPRLLDVGCGDGLFMQEMQLAGWSVVGVDTDAAAVAAARRRGLNVHVGTVGDLGEQAGPFHAVTLHHVVEHFANPVEELRKSRALLRPDGQLWLATPNLGSCGHRRYGADWRGLEPPRHLVLFTARALRRALDRAGFDVELLDPPRVNSMFSRSEELRARRLGRPVSPRALLRSALAASVCNAHARRDPTAGDELVALARPRFDPPQPIG